MVISLPVFSVFLEEENKQCKSFCVIQLIRKPITELKKTSFHCFNRNTHTGHVGADIWSFDRELYYQRKEKKSNHKRVKNNARIVTIAEYLFHCLPIKFF